ncbi:MAG: hypothetical protein KGJ62_11905 [Armatimonadetes bacterium]|nr:hypothetical protein [Armatimonadota bacterium]MDE2206419.1 hypothetical protein [Armatimonadota bacterium]
MDTNHAPEERHRAKSWSACVVRRSRRRTTRWFLATALAATGCANHPPSPMTSSAAPHLVQATVPFAIRGGDGLVAINVRIAGRPCWLAIEPSVVPTYITSAAARRLNLRVLADPQWLRHGWAGSCAAQLSIGGLRIGGGPLPVAGLRPRPNGCDGAICWDLLSQIILSVDYQRQNVTMWGGERPLRSLLRYGGYRVRCSVPIGIRNYGGCAYPATVDGNPASFLLTFGGTHMVVPRRALSGGPPRGVVRVRDVRVGSFDWVDAPAIRAGPGGKDPPAQVDAPFWRSVPVLILDGPARRLYLADEITSAPPSGRPKGS